VSGAPLSSGLTSYRVRGKISGGNSGGGNSGGGKSSRSDGQGGGAAFVTVVNTEAAEEGRLAADLAKAKARMAKHQKLQVGPERVLHADRESNGVREYARWTREGQGGFQEGRHNCCLAGCTLWVYGVSPLTPFPHRPLL
jgi:hypothetical protein